MEALRQAGADVIIALTHLSIAEDRALAQQVPGISVILGGHDHEPITWYEGGTLIHKAGYDAHYLGRIDLTIEKKVTEKGSQVTVTPSWRMIANRGVTPDPGVAVEVARYTAALDKELGQPLGQTQTALNSQTAEVRTRETTMGNLVADALREALQADVALVNGGGIRGNRLYEAGTTLTRRDILQELPFGNPSVLVELSGADLLAALENGVSQVENKAGRFPQVSGLQLTYNPGKPAGSRVLDMQVGGKALDRTATYRVATSDFLLKGGDGYSSLSKGKVLIDASGGTLTQEWNAERRPPPQPAGDVFPDREIVCLRQVLDVDDAVRGGCLRPTLGGHVTPMPPASSREMACWAFPTRTVSGPPKGSAARSLTFLPGTSASFVR